MRLSERVGGAGDRRPPAFPPPSHDDGAPGRGREASYDPLAELKERAQTALFERLGATVTTANLGNPAMQREINTLLDEIIGAEQVLLSRVERRELIDAVTDNLVGLGPIQRFLEDPTITEIMVNAPDAVWVERGGRLELAEVTFHSRAHVRSVIERIVSRAGRRIDESNPMVDARLPDGSRVNAVLPPLTVDSPTLTIRKFSDSPIGIAELVASGSLSEPIAEFLHACVASRSNIVVSGGTGSGKTTLLNALSSFIPGDERIITVEDTAELRLQQRHVVRMEARAANLEGAGAVGIRDLVRNALRMRPDRIVVGECRGPEALDMLQAMNTGHEGSITTLHANSTRDAIARVETMVMMAGMELPLRAVREQVASAIDLVVHLSRLGDGSRRVVEICEVTGMEGEVVQLNPLFLYDWSAGRDLEGRFAGQLQPTGIRPQLSERVEARGFQLPAALFGVPFGDL